MMKGYHCNVCLKTYFDPDVNTHALVFNCSDEDYLQAERYEAEQIWSIYYGTLQEKYL